MYLTTVAAEQHIIYPLSCFLAALLLLTAAQLKLLQQELRYLCVFLFYELITLGLGTYLMNNDMQLIKWAVAMALLDFVLTGLLLYLHYELMLLACFIFTQWIKTFKQLRLPRVV
ncbi:uncharacterized protein LOC117134957 [Drosophila busckii]|uniref:uncharacterized protein LOC117134957 n=1 Tax=Drosophila busckii TaxID=30019 RepID=UPI001432EDA5|nr:uncharacterized protein LOC117134957 [Drosophila busckii]